MCSEWKSETRNGHENKKEQAEERAGR